MPELNQENIENILSDYLGGKFPVTSLQEYPLEGSGENELTKLILTVKCKKAIGKDFTDIEAVAKSIRVDGTSASKLALKKEIDFYKTVLPKLQDFQKQSQFKSVFNACPEFIGSRLNLDSGNAQDATLMLQNLWESGFIQVDSQEGFDLETTKCILESVAEFHAISMVMKKRKPMEFQRQVKSKCVEIEQSTQPTTNGLVRNTDDSFWEILYENNACLPYINKLKQALGTYERPFPISPNEPFATVIHNDLWVKNIFIKFHKNEPSNVALIDFQKYIFGSPVSDVLNLLLTSTDYRVLDQHFKELLKHYHSSLIKNLKVYKEDLELFDWSAFSKEVKLVAVPALLKAIFFLIEVVYGVDKMSSFPFEAKQRIWLIIQQIGGNDWL